MNIKTFYEQFSFVGGSPLDPQLLKTRKVLDLILQLDPTGVFDFGCGEGDLFERLRERGYNGTLFGCDVSERSIRKVWEKGFPGVQIPMDNYEILRSCAPGQLITLLDVMEHVFDPEVLLKTALDNAGYDGYVLISTPNLAAWYNRIAVLFGYQPINVEAGATRNFGYPVNIPGSIAGHIRTMTHRALSELVSHAGGEIYIEDSYDVDPCYYRNPLVKLGFRAAAAILPKTMHGHMLWVVRPKRRYYFFTRREYAPGNMQVLFGTSGSVRS